mmetsp:Transcript_1008/g.3113  ORF Transcript_1008/g.3113 Transcript_1008/m.3113 type:complete len:252 (+) Transcript_1008:216-971(+)
MPGSLQSGGLRLVLRTEGEPDLFVIEVPQLPAVPHGAPENVLPLARQGVRAGGVLQHPLEAGPLVVGLGQLIVEAGERVEHLVPGLGREGQEPGVALEAAREQQPADVLGRPLERPLALLRGLDLHQGQPGALPVALRAHGLLLPLPPLGLGLQVLHVVAAPGHVDGLSLLVPLYAVPSLVDVGYLLASHHLLPQICLNVIDQLEHAALRVVVRRADLTAIFKYLGLSPPTWKAYHCCAIELAVNRAKTLN